MGFDALALLLLGEIGRSHAVAFIIRFSDHHETITVAELGKTRVIGIVTGPDGVDIVFPHHGQVTEHLFKGNGEPGDRIAVVTVDAAEEEGTLIEFHNPVMHTDGTETDHLGDHFAAAGERQGIEVGMLRIPEHGRIDLQGKSICAVCLCNGIAFCIGDDGMDGNGCAAESHIDSHTAVNGRMDKVIGNACLRTLEKIDITENAAHAEFVLVFHIASVTPFEHQNSDVVLAFTDDGSDIKFTGGMGNLAVTDIGSVDPHIEAAVYAFKDQIGAGCGRLDLIGKGSAVGTAGIQMRYVGRVAGKRIADVGVLVMVIAVVLPA